MSTLGEDNHFRQTKWNIEKLIQSEEIRTQYQIAISERLQHGEYDGRVNEEQESVDRQWEKIQAAVKNTAPEFIKKRNDRKGKEWYNEECRELNSRKTEARNRLLSRNTRSGMQRYKKLRAAAKKKIRKKKRVSESKNG